MKKQSIWYEGVKFDNCPGLDKDIFVDILIVGGGITGISTAYYLKDSNLKVCLVDRNSVGCSTTGKSTGKLTYLQDNVYLEIIKNYDYKHAQRYLNSQLEAINLVKKIIEDHNIQCDLQQVKSLLFTNNKNNIKKLKRIGDFLVDNNINVLLGKQLGKFKSKQSILVDDAYVFNPLKYVNKLKQIIIDAGVQVYEGTLITHHEKEGNVYVCQTPHNKISAKQVVFACHYPYFLTPFLMPFKTYKEQSTLVASKIHDTEKISGINMDKDVISFRYYDDYLICLDDTHKICDNEKLSIDEIKNKFKKYIKNIDYFWVNHDLITTDKMPYIGRLVKGEQLYLATGYNTWGLTNGSLAGKIISDMVLNKENEYIDLFDPNRPTNLHRIKNNVNIAGYNIKAYVKPKKTDNVGYKYIKGKKIAIYIDDKKVKHMVYNKCPHLKCNLIFNEQEKTWDCPCHGSRFDVDGNCILGPSKYSIKYK